MLLSIPVLICPLLLQEMRLDIDLRLTAHLPECSSSPLVVPDLVIEDQQLPLVWTEILLTIPIERL